VTRAEEARAAMLELFPRGFEEIERGARLELAAYTDAEGATGMWRAFGEFSASDVEDGWEDRWRRFHRPVRVGPLWIGPPWDEPPRSALAVVIDPGRAFGTGAHETTRLCLEFLLELDRGSLTDVGCGSGVLAIAAARLGYRFILAVDHDAVAVAAARQNADANGVRIVVRRADALHEDLPVTDLVVANLSLGAVEGLAPRLGVARLVTSGYLASEQPALAGFDFVERRTRGGWAADLWRRD
jgi:ribosomal protein L11 methyltransferase